MSRFENSYAFLIKAVSSVTKHFPKVRKLRKYVTEVFTALVVDMIFSKYSRSTERYSAFWACLNASSVLGKLGLPGKETMCYFKGLLVGVFWLFEGAVVLPRWILRGLWWSTSPKWSLISLSSDAELAGINYYYGCCRCYLLEFSEGGCDVPLLLWLMLFAFPSSINSGCFPCFCTTAF
jgi:hypothetical protein